MDAERVEMGNIYTNCFEKSLEEIMHMRPQARWKDNIKISSKHGIR
jgi:hypothetical protein